MFSRSPAGMNRIVGAAGPVVGVVLVLRRIRILGSDGTGCAKFDSWDCIGCRLEPARTAAVRDTVTLNFLQSRRATDGDHQFCRHARELVERLVSARFRCACLLWHGGCLRGGQSQLVTRDQT